MSKEPRFLSDQFLNRALKVLGALILLIALLYMLTLFSPLWRSIFTAVRIVLIPVGLAWLISLLIFPIVRMLERKGIGPRAISVSIVYVFTVALIVGVFYFVMPLVFEQIRTFFDRDYPLITNYFQTQLRDDFIFGQGAYDFFIGTVIESGLITRSIDQFVSSFSTIVPSTAFAMIVIVAILPILLLFYLLDYERVNRALKALIPERYAKLSTDLAERMNQTVGAYIRGQVFLMFAIGMIATMIYRLIGLEYFFIFGIMVGLANIVPYFGILIAMIPIAAYAYITKDVGPSPLLIIGIHIALQFVEGNVFQPVIMGRQLDLHPIIIVISILFFGSLFGLLGVIFASPIAATLRVVYIFYKERRALMKEQVSLVEGGDN